MKSDSMRLVFRDASIVTVLSAAFGLLANSVHPEAIPYIAKQEYEILVPCPEPGGEVTEMEVDDPALFSQDTFVVDARSDREFTDWRFRKATNMPYDYLDPTPKETIQGLAKAIASSRARRVVVYGDGDLPDTGQQLGKEISGHGIKNVFFLRGGAPVLKQRPEKTVRGNR
ncbi:MAG: rhodanese-like domain-containing protein [Proteobacteria bacterium]|nr:rhodanese-like domain-containing protein [Pseudomonadota bacterium]